SAVQFLVGGACRLRRMPATGTAGSIEIIVGVSGGSGAVLARRFVQVAAASRGLLRLHLVVSDAALRVARTELDGTIDTAKAFFRALELPGDLARRVMLHDNAD